MLEMVYNCGHQAAPLVPMHTAYCNSSFPPIANNVVIFIVSSLSHRWYVHCRKQFLQIVESTSNGHYAFYTRSIYFHGFHVVTLNFICRDFKMHLAHIQYVPGLSLQEKKKIIFDFTQKLQRNNIFCFI
jgi:hypothetical protein